MLKNNINIKAGKNIVEIVLIFLLKTIDKYKEIVVTTLTNINSNQPLSNS